MNCISTQSNSPINFNLSSSLPNLTYIHHNNPHINDILSICKTEQVHKNYFTNLPTEILNMIFMLVPVKTGINLIKTCKRAYDIGKETIYENSLFGTHKEFTDFIKETTLPFNNSNELLNKNFLSDFFKKHLLTAVLDRSIQAGHIPTVLKLIKTTINALPEHSNLKIENLIEARLIRLDIKQINALGLSLKHQHLLLSAPGILALATQPFDLYAFSQIPEEYCTNSQLGVIRAMVLKNRELIQLMEKSRFFMHSFDESGKNALHYLSTLENGRSNDLIDSFNILEIKNDFNKSDLMELIRELSNYYQADFKNSGDMTPIENSILYGDLDTVRSLFAVTPKYLIDEPEGTNTLIHLIATRILPDSDIILEMFLANNDPFDLKKFINAPGILGSTPLHHAIFVANGNTATVEILLKNGALSSIYKKNDLGQTPLDIAERIEDREIIEFLKEAQKNMIPSPAGLSSYTVTPRLA